MWGPLKHMAQSGGPSYLGDTIKDIKVGHFITNRVSNVKTAKRITDFPSHRLLSPDITQSLNLKYLMIPPLWGGGCTTVSFVTQESLLSEFQNEGSLSPINDNSVIFKSAMIVFCWFVCFYARLRWHRTVHEMTSEVGGSRETKNKLQGERKTVRSM